MSSKVQKLARALRALVIIIFICNLLALLAVPIMALATPGLTVRYGLDGLAYLFGIKELDNDIIYIPFTVMFFASWLVVWEDAYSAVLAVFLWSCGVCTAVILWQGKRVLDTILKAEPFTMNNADNMKRAAVCCFVISGAALARLIWGLVYYASIRPLLTYNALFVPVFLVGGLLFLVMSALFRQAAELKAENDLTI